MATKQQQTKRRSFRGRILIASPFADATAYRRSVVLLLEDNSEGAAGVVIDDSFSQALEQLNEQLPRMMETEQIPSVGLAMAVKVAMWQSGQLDEELESGLWFNIPANPQRIFSDGVPAWHELVRQVGRSVYRDALGIKEFPANVWLN